MYLYYHKQEDNMFQSVCNLLSLIILFVISLQAHALQSDAKELMYIISDSASHNGKTGTKIFIGHVKLDQGTSHLIADKVITQADKKHQVHTITAYGFNNLAHYWTTLDSNHELLDAKAKIIIYHPKTGDIDMKENVIVQQAKNHFKGQSIHYNNLEQTITVPESSHSHALLIYNPNQ